MHIVFDSIKQLKSCIDAVVSSDFDLKYLENYIAKCSDTDKKITEDLLKRALFQRSFDIEKSKIDDWSDLEFPMGKEYKNYISYRENDC